MLVSRAINADEAALAMPFVRCLVRLIRAPDSYGSWERQIGRRTAGRLHHHQKTAPCDPMIGDPDPDVLWRLDMFHTAVGLAIEERSGLMTSPMMEMKAMGASDDCFSRSGSSSFCPDVHRFGFDTFRQLAKAGMKLVDDATSATEAFRDVARA
ncbi:DUF269 domain-containing protein [Mesorhizobium australicum]|uniref:DUF269 domain-containing protein n=1 Tax=Mesorhizobium australicum TaxID=536018 RepID=UPI00333B370D